MEPEDPEDSVALVWATLKWERLVLTAVALGVGVESFHLTSPSKVNTLAAEALDRLVLQETLEAPAIRA